MHLIDTHTHIFTSAFEGEYSSILQSARQKGVKAMLLPNIDQASVSEVISAIAGQPDVFPMWGLHPCHVEADWENVLAEIEPLFQTHPAKAVGEIGLDFYWSKDYVQEQIDCLKTQLGWALKYQLPVSLHTREATRECIDVVKTMPGIRGVFHCFSGTEAEAREIIEMGMFLGVGGSITYKKNPVREFIAKLPLDSIVLETDAPYLPPVPYRGKRNEPAYLVEITYALSDLFGLPPAKIAEITTNNAVSLFALSI